MVKCRFVAVEAGGAYSYQLKVLKASEVVKITKIAFGFKSMFFSNVTPGVRRNCRLLLQGRTSSVNTTDEVACVPDARTALMCEFQCVELEVSCSKPKGN
jgi:hypothetical protein